MHHRSETTEPGQDPQFSVITAAYNVARYVDDFVASLRRQTVPADSFELVVVDDGSTDETRATFLAALDGAGFASRVITQENTGQGGARNHGIDLARGEWLTFPDPDDWLADDYLEVVARQIAATPNVHMVATNRLMFQEATGVLEDRHPLRRHFAKDQVVSLDRFPGYFHGSAPAAFFRASVIARSGIVFDERIRSNFEDGHFCVQYLLASEAPDIAFLKSASYFYRKRADNSSTLQGKHSDPEHFISTPRHGYLDALRRSLVGDAGYAPEWLQNFILYELSWYFSEDQQMGVPTVATGDVGAEFRSILAEIARHLDPTVVFAFDIRRFALAAKQALVHGIPGETWMTDYVVMDHLDTAQHAVRMVYRYAGEEPDVRFYASGLPVDPLDVKRRSIEYFGAEVLTEVIAWVSTRRTLTVRVAGRGLPIVRNWPGAQRYSLRPAQIRTAFGLPADEAVEPRLRDQLLATPKRRRRPHWHLRLADSLPARWWYRRGWIFMDRVGDAEDSAEILFEHVRTHNPGVNARFVIERGTPGWTRLRRAHGRRVLAYGSLAWRVALRNADNVISSHADRAITDPPDYTATMGAPRWRFVFLQHGVIKDDISRWLNLKRFAMFVASTPAEYASLVGDHTPYSVTSHEVKLTGLPRFDALQRLDDARTGNERPMILVAPTWRDWLNAKLAEGETRRGIHADVAESEYVRNWVGLLSSQAVREAAARVGARIALLPHPNLREIAEHIDLPDHVELLSFDDGAQRHFVDASLLITDYSSMAFNAAYLRRPVVYFQFDADRYNAGAHIARPGYFDYDRDGFGPRVTDLDAAIAQVVAMVERGFTASPEHAARIEAAFPHRDGNASARTVKAIKNLRREAKPSRARASSPSHAAATSVDEEAAATDVSPRAADGVAAR